MSTSQRNRISNRQNKVVYAVCFLSSIVNISCSSNSFTEQEFLELKRKNDSLTICLQNCQYYFSAIGPTVNNGCCNERVIIEADKMVKLGDTLMVKLFMNEMVEPRITYRLLLDDLSKDHVNTQIIHHPDYYLVPVVCDSIGSFKLCGQLISPTNQGRMTTFDFEYPYEVVAN